MRETRPKQLCQAIGKREQEEEKEAMALTTDNVKQAIFNHVGFDPDRQYRPDWEGIKYSFNETQVVFVDGEPYHINVHDFIFGGEGDYNADVYVVFRVAGLAEVKYFQIAGYYQSYEGTTWETNLYQVVPEEVQVTKWRMV